MDGYVLQFYSRGGSRSLGDGATASSADLYLIDMSQPLATMTSDHAQTLLFVARHE
jgi:hypothetical protein